MSPGHILSLNMLWPYLFSVLISCITVAVRIALMPVLAYDAPMIIFIMPVVLSAWYGGAGPGLLATVLCGFAGTYLFLEPAFSLRIVSLADQVRLIIFAVEGAAISTLSQQRQSAAQQAHVASVALTESEERFHLLVHGVTDYLIVMLDPAGHIVSWNLGATRIKGYQPEEILGTHFSRFYRPEDIACGLPDRALTIAAAEGHYEETAGWRVRRDGSHFRTHTVISALRDRNGELRGFAKVTRDITARIEGEAQQRNSEARLAGIVDSAMDAIITVDAGQRIVVFNRAAEEMFGYQASEATGMHLGHLLPSQAREAHQQHVRSFGETGTTTRAMHGTTPLQGLRRDGSTFPIEASISHITVDGQPLYTAIVRDVSARQQLEVQFLQAQKMEIVGLLAGGIAHDFNNLLTVIQGYADFARDELPADSAVHADLGLVTDAAKRAANLTRQLLAFARQQPLTSRPIDVNQMVSDLVKLLGRLLGTDIVVATELAPGTLYVYGDPGQLEQVLVNLCVNARDAMPDGGKLTIATTAIGSATIQLTVRDTGTGMSPEVQARVFDPFFTTKPTGQGTGLGLATCYGIITQHGGTIRCSSTPGEGSTFSVELPRLTVPEGYIPDEFARPAAPGGAETILLVEDEPGVRSMAERVLRRRGYEVITAQNGVDALQVARERGHRGIDLLLTDMVMPGLKGSTVASQLRELIPGLRVLIMSAHTNGHRPGTPFLPKPFTAIELADAVRAALDDDNGKPSLERAAGT